MCGLVGIICRDGSQPELSLLREMGDLIAYRGPDASGHFLNRHVGFYHRRLSIIDLATGDQPMTADGLTVVFNGEIYNYVELRQELRQRGHEFRTTSDTEVLLRAYAEYGPAFVGRLNGMFAFLLYDAPNQRVIAARDPFGIKPLYCYADERRVAYASEIKSLLRHPAVGATPDCIAMRDYLTFQYVLDERTLFEGITKVPPGHYHTIDLRSGSLTVARYWEPDFTVDKHHTEEYFTVELRRRLEASVQWQLRSDVPVGAHLSGGMDSSLVTLFAARLLPNRIKTFTGAFDGGAQFDETPFAREVGKLANAETFEVYPTEQQLVDLLPRLIWHMDEPAAGPGLFPQYIVSRLAAGEVKVVLGGQGGDEVFGGYSRYVLAYLEQALKGAIFETNEEQEHIVSLSSILRNLPSLERYVPMMRMFWQDGLFEPMDRRYFRLVDRSAGALELFSDDYRSTFEREAVFERFQGVFNRPDTLSYYNKMTHFDLRANLPALLQVEDRVSMAVSLESRVPLLDTRIVELVTSMPPRMKFRGGEMKYILKRAAKDILPASVAQRKDKMGFPVPLHLWSKGVFHEFVCDTLLSASCLDRGLFSESEIRKLIHSADVPFGRQLWGTLCLELWYREFIDRR